MDASSSSKVTVEYHDPSGVFPLISRDIAARLPLRNLNWQTPSRPLRQIRQLHVDFVPDQFTENSLRPPAQRLDSNGPSSFDIVRSGTDPVKDAVKERRHQIPGLKTSPYLKLYILRCDDKDTYKAADRKRVREWIRENAQSGGKRGENHDAFEWLILHIVIPGTVAANESRWRESTKEPDELKERKTSNLKLPGKSTRTVFDRLRADFNESSKTGHDRVAQIRLRKNDVPPDLLPTPAAVETFGETAQERELAWKDLMDKFKTLILGPFDTRVRQYEADIAEQESRRSLPGFNFCTFSIHKEGLAKALESIGLVEDALVIYDELSLGLETVVRDLASGQAEGTATTFATFTDDIQARILGGVKSKVNGTHGDTNSLPGCKPRIDLFSKDYREQIVRSNISEFDFFCYLFSRQKALILRLANTRAARAELGGNTTKDGGEDLVLISEVCWRASSFIHNNARTLRQDLCNGPKTNEHALSQADVEALVCSWTYAVAEHVLNETAAPVLDLAQSESKAAPNSINKLKRSDFDFAMGASPYPQRSSSLVIRKSAPELQRPVSIAVESMTSPPSSAGTDLSTKNAGIPGLPELATYRAELVMVQRRMVELLAARRGWRAGWTALKHRHREEHRTLEEVDLNADDDQAQEPEHQVKAEDPTFSPLLHLHLAQDLESETAFHSAYERLSEIAMRYYALATQTKSVEAIIGDLAVLKRDRGDVASAESYLKHLLPSYEQDGWSTMQAEMLGFYADCLKQLDQRQRCVETVLKLLSKVAGRNMGRKLPTVAQVNDASIVDDEFDASGLLAEAVAMSASLATEISSSLNAYFSSLELEREIMHLDEKDGFALRVRFRHVLHDDAELDQVSLRLVSVDDPNQAIFLVSDGAVIASLGLVELDLETTATAFGAFLADSVTIKAGKLRFTHYFRPKSQPTLRIKDDELAVAKAPEESRTQPFVFLYPPEHAFDAQVAVRKDIHIDKPRWLQLSLSSGWNEIQSISLRTRPTSAGLRLHLADATFDGVAWSDEAASKPGQLAFGGMEPWRSALVEIPYTLEQATPDISMRLDIRYDTTKGSFSFLKSLVLRHELPLDVDVDDKFLLDTLFSNFTVRTMASLPLVITETTLKASPVYDVQEPPAVGPLTVFANAPSQLVYKITRKERPDARSSKREAALALSLQYTATAELLARILREKFATTLKQSQYQALSRLLLPLVADRCNDLFTGAQLEIAVLLDQVRTPSFDDIGWSAIVATLPHAVRAELSEWLLTWHREHPRLAIEYESEGAKDVVRRITISVDVPTVDMVFNAALTLRSTGSLEAPGADVLTLGKPVSAELRVKHTDAWSARLLLAQTREKEAPQDRFVLEVQADPDTWLIGGPRRVHFVPVPDEAITLSLTLIPLKLGIHHLPLVDIQVEPNTLEQGQARPKPNENTVSCETHYESGGQTVEVIRDVRMTRVHIADAATVDSHPPAQSGMAIRTTAEPG